MLSQQLVPAVINGSINGAIAWAMHRDTAALALWGGSGYAGDWLATGALLPGLTWWILHPLLRHQAATGKAPSTAGVPRPWLSPRLPAGFWGGSVAIGAAGLALGVAACALAQVVGAPQIPGPAYAWAKGLYAGALTWLLQPVMLFAILAAAPPAASPAAHPPREA